MISYTFHHPSLRHSWSQDLPLLISQYFWPSLPYYLDLCWAHFRIRGGIYNTLTIHRASCDCRSKSRLRRHPQTPEGVPSSILEVGREGPRAVVFFVFVSRMQPSLASESASTV
jgi:hypothetical protein